MNSRTINNFSAAFLGEKPYLLILHTTMVVRASCCQGFTLSCIQGLKVSQLIGSRSGTDKGFVL